jgi:large subunit ribosomal protein L25
MVSRNLVDVEVACLPADLPEFLEVDLGGLDLGQTLHLSDIKLPSNVELPALSQGSEHDLPVVAIQMSRTGGDVSEETS